MNPFEGKMPELPANENLSEQAWEHLYGLAGSMLMCRQAHLPIPGMIVPTHLTKCAVSIVFRANPEYRAAQTWVAASEVLRTWHPEEALMIFDGYARTVESVNPEKDAARLDQIAQQGLEHDPFASEALLVMHTRVGYGGHRAVSHLSVPYGYDDDGLLCTRSQETWVWGEFFDGPLPTAFTTAVTWEVREGESVCPGVSDLEDYDIRVVTDGVVG